MTLQPTMNAYRFDGRPHPCLKAQRMSRGPWYEFFVFTSRPTKRSIARRLLGYHFNHVSATDFNVTGLPTWQEAVAELHQEFVRRFMKEPLADRWGITGEAIRGWLRECYASPLIIEARHAKYESQRPSLDPDE